ncbi:MAG: hypothetical protein PHI84_21635 [Kiritimatiellae bacterium]|nr:hypothetical protein [Kiritimatiellia bacterium]
MLTMQEILQKMMDLGFEKSTRSQFERDETFFHFSGFNSDQVAAFESNLINLDKMIPAAGRKFYVLPLSNQVYVCAWGHFSGNEN